MKVLILGGKCMSGHVMKEYLKQKPQYDIHYTSRVINDKNSLVNDRYYLKSATNISKYALLKKIKEIFVKDNVKIIPDECSNTQFPLTNKWLIYLKDWIYNL
ncbi:hypothetical protein [Metabacillus sediminilitoris]|uniref:Uncharacterized protein n=1 Tax=Metabacillus sediminilitoris TaxID=2567941 RepID=A0A4S4BUZ2_9BACI|nr:hypothetical protein [Metabacillus sediminilitoris]QGQ44725.1 hypothetical protein GMB29_05235 [Metabacillus sediminilitoris]THF78927.1 hypothetical protein E6W99_14485 [Metabacillus sediminilitoris]